MDVTEVAGRAVAVVGSYLASVTAGVVDQTQQCASQALTTLIVDRLGRTQTDAPLLRQLQLQPTDAGVRDQVGAAVARLATEDPAFAAELGRAVHAVNTSPNAIDHAVVRGQTTLHPEGGWTNRTAADGGGRSRPLKIGALVAILLVGIAVGAVGTYLLADGGDGDPASPAPTQRADAGTNAGTNAGTDTDAAEAGGGGDTMDVPETPATVDELPSATGSVPVEGYLVAEPDAGLPGDPVVVTGTGFTPGERVRIYWNYIGEDYALRDTTADADGAISVEVTVPSHADPDNTHHLVALGLTSEYEIDTVYRVIE